METSKITIAKCEKRIFYNVEGDKCEYYDLENLRYRHPELADYVDMYKYDLERKFFQLKQIEEEKMRGIYEE